MSAEIVPFRPKNRAAALRCRMAAAIARLHRVLDDAKPAGRGAATRAGANAGEGGRRHPAPLPRRGFEERRGLLVTALPLARSEDGALVVLPPDGAA